MAGCHENDLAGGFTYFLCSSLQIGRWSNLTNVFQMGWNNLVMVKFLGCSVSKTKISLANLTGKRDSCKIHSTGVRWCQPDKPINSKFHSEQWCSDGDRKSPHNPDHVPDSIQRTMIFHWAPVSLACSLATYSTITKLKTTPFGYPVTRSGCHQANLKFAQIWVKTFKHFDHPNFQKPLSCDGSCDFFALKLIWERII